ncbi:MAG: pyridoxal-phosphate dependent enzyme, partial [Novibacillus thermophilus]
AKLDAIRRYGVEIRNDFDSQDDAEAFCSQLEREGLTVIKPFDDPSVIAGQGTIGLELMEDLPHVETVVIPLSGGGLLSGIGLALKANNPRIRVVGVSVERGAVMYESIQAGKPVILEEKETLADSLLGGIGLDNRFTLSMVQQLADEILLVSEPSIAAGMAYMLEAHRMGVEGAAAVGLAAVMEQKLKVDPGENIAVIVSGNNVDLSTLLRVTQQYSSSTNHLT